MSPESGPASQTSAVADSGSPRSMSSMLPNLWNAHASEVNVRMDMVDTGPSVNVKRTPSRDTTRLNDGQAEVSSARETGMS